MADTFLKALFNNFISSSGAIASHGYDTLPDNDDITITAATTADTYGDWSEIASSIGASDLWLCGYHLGAVSEAQDGKADFGTGASGSETRKLTVPLTRVDVDASGHQYGVMFTLPFAIRIPSGTRISGRYKTGTTDATTANVVALLADSLSG